MYDISEIIFPGLLGLLMGVIGLFAYIGLKNLWERLFPGQYEVCTSETPAAEPLPQETTNSQRTEHLTDEQHQAYYLREKGFSLSQTAKVIGCSRRTIVNWCRLFRGDVDTHCQD